MKNYGISRDVMTALWSYIAIIFSLLIVMADVSITISLIICILLFLITLAIREVWPVPVTEADVRAVLLNANHSLTHKEIEERLNDVFGLTHTWRKVSRNKTKTHIINLTQSNKLMHRYRKVIDEENGGKKEILEFSLEDTQTQ